MKNFCQKNLMLILLIMSCTFLNAQTVFRGVVIDEATNQPIENARVGVSNQGVGVITNELGNFTYRKYHEVVDNASILRVSAPGYKTLANDVSVIRQMINNRGAIYLTAQDVIPERQNILKKIAIFWDASKRAKSRDIEGEKDFLLNYLSNHSFSEISLTIFNETVVFSEIYNTSNSALPKIPSILDTLEYKGFSDFGNIKYQEVDEVLLIAQEKPILGKPQIHQEIPFHVANFNAKDDAISYFKDITTFTYGVYNDITAKQTEAIAPRDKISATISGVVISNNKNMNYAMVVKEGSIQEYYTNQKGYFSLSAAPGDVLTFYCLGHYPKKITVTEKDFYNIKLASKAEILDEVVLKGMSTAPEYAYDKKAQTDKISGRIVPIRTHYKEDWNKTAGQISGIVNGWYGVRSVRADDGRTYTSVKGMCAKFLVDGIETPPEAINVSSMARITIYAPYGSVLPCPARIIITTVFHPDIIDQKLRSYGIDPLRNNNYTEEVPTIENKKGTYFKENIITGTVFSNNLVLQNVSVFKQGALKEYKTDSNGAFSIPAAEGDILLLKHLGMYPKTVVVTSKNDYKISLATKSEVLDEVELSEKVEKFDPKYDSYDPVTRMEYVNGKTYNVRNVLFKEDLNKTGIDIYEVVKSSSSRIGVNGSFSALRKNFFFKKGNKEIALSVVVDGEPMDVALVNPLTVDRVSVYLAPIERDSKIFITTRNHPDIYKKFLEDNDLTLKNNTYSEDVKPLKNPGNSYFNEKEIKGIVTSNKEPLQYVSIHKKGTLKEIVTATDGTFNLSAAEGDILLIKHIGMYPKTVIVTQDDEYFIELINKTQILDAVTLENQKKEEQEQIETATGKRNKSAVGFQVEDGLSKFVAPTDTDFFQVVMKLPNIVVDLETRTIFHQRSFGAKDQSPMMILIDDTPVTQSIAMILDPQMITDITTLASLAATNRYGSQAFGGVLKITTKNNSGASIATLKRDYTVKNNDYKEEVAVLNFDAIADGYIDDLTQKKSTKLKLETYKKLKDEYIDKVDFYVDMTLYFQNIDAGVAATIRSDFAQIAGENIKALRVLAYLNEYAGEYLKAQKIYERILELKPSQPQSYRDVALIYQETGEYDKSLELYINMLGDQIKGVDFSGLEVPLGNELKRLVSLHKNKIDYSRLPNDWLAINFNIDVRLTLDWSDPNAPFEFQFVDPKKKFYTWQSANEEKNSDSEHVSEEFIVDDADSGKWLVNIRYTGQEDEIHIPPYLKYTIYKDFGTDREEKIVKLVRLDTQLDKVTLDSFVY